ncbi:MAG TPA: hypothetical protein VE287_12740 [Actinopolymorphaceae bacterium]|jgi:hypothetical protein|nr:hypothetical protein [Actinopolymorphaceae bacterium]
MIGDLSPPEWRDHVHTDTGREITELTTGRGQDLVAGSDQDAT